MTISSSLKMVVFFTENSEGLFQIKTFVDFFSIFLGVFSKLLVSLTNFQIT